MCVCVCVFFYIFLLVSFHACSSLSILFHLRISLSLSLSHTFPFLTERFVFLRKKKSKKLVHSRLLGLNLTNLLFTLRLFCFSFFFFFYLMPIITSHLTFLSWFSLSLSFSQCTRYSFFFFSLLVPYLFPLVTLYNSLRLAHPHAHASHTRSLSLSLCYLYTRFVSRLLLPSHSLSFCVPFLRVSRSIHLCLERHATPRANTRERRMSSILLLRFLISSCEQHGCLHDLKHVVSFSRYNVGHDSNYGQRC